MGAPRHASAKLSLVVVLAAFLVLAGTPAASSLPGGVVATDVDQANASFRKTVETCIDHDLSVSFTAGTVRDPIGTPPTPFSDVVATLRVFDTCAVPEQELLVLIGVTTGVDPNFTRLEEAILDEVTVELSDGGVSTTLVFDLVWHGNDDATELITRDGNRLRVERIETAEVTGQVTDGGTLAFTANDLTSASISFLQELVLPRP